MTFNNLAVPKEDLMSAFQTDRRMPTMNPSLSFCVDKFLNGLHKQKTESQKFG